MQQPCYETKNQAMEDAKNRLVRPGNNCWEVKHPITGVEFTERSQEAIETRILWFYSR
jgi:hypothetical protein